MRLPRSVAVNRWSLSKRAMCSRGRRAKSVCSACSKGAGNNPLKPLKRINGADPFVIAMAMSNGSRWTGVADEHSGSHENRKIPFVCQAEGVTCITFQQMMLAEGWQF